MKNYFHSQGKKPEYESKRYGFPVIEILHFLKGKPWDEVALAYISAFNPEKIRVIRFNDSQTCDAMQGRVTVSLNESERIQKITQEVRVWLPNGVAHGEALRAALNHGIDSPQCQWHNDENISSYYMDGINGKYYKILNDGSSVEYPR